MGESAGHSGPDALHILIEDTASGQSSCAGGRLLRDFRATEQSCVPFTMYVREDAVLAPRWCAYCGERWAYGHEGACASPWGRDDLAFCIRDGKWLGTHARDAGGALVGEGHAP